MSGPIKPEEIVEAKKRHLPNEVFQCFNEMIAENWSGGVAVVLQRDVVARIAHRLGMEEKKVYDHKLLEVEDAYRDAGWNVTYDKPGYNESYPARFEFRKRR